MEKIEHTTVATNGINMHVASIGTGPVILFLHGFPELWYSWRHQLLSLSSLGYRCIAPDLRGYGDTDAPALTSQYTVFHIVGDLVGLLDSLGIEQVYLVGHDWGAWIAWTFALFRPDRIKALVNTSVVFMPRHPQISPLQGFKLLFGDDYYICRFQEPGEAERGFAQLGTTSLFRRFLASRDPTPPSIPKDIGFGAIPDPSSLPSWLTEEDIDYYATKFNQTGFTGGLNYYRNINLSWELTAPWTGSQIKVPVKFIIGDLDITYNVPGQDWGAIIAWHFCTFRPDRIRALINTSVVFSPRNPQVNPVDYYGASLGDDFYICRFQVAGEAEEDFAKVDTPRMMAKFFTMLPAAPPLIPKGKGFSSLPDPPSLPSWLSQEDINYYASKFDKTGFTGALNYYRALNLTWELTAPWTGIRIKVPVKFIIGDRDLTYHFPGHDWGAIIAWHFCTFRPDRIRALVNTSVPLMPRNPRVNPVDCFRALLGDDFYMCRFQEVGEAEEDFGREDTSRMMTKILTVPLSSALLIPKGRGLSSLPDPPSLPSWLSEADIKYYASKFEKTGFTGALNYYRALNLYVILHNFIYIKLN
ncbi:hypothetical protein Tsubulata_039877 [Turnera subulata]|uniref:soluble epoxide hydrolase n=1 Tax=Turnera subulata TaxID=218843 RepID=A0A9Q0FHG8_9ROSI|nr:hypothetical protein Tsubulata_039877 [Turnera subulata]